MGCRHMGYNSERASLTADIGALAGLSLTYLCAPISPALLHLLAVSPFLSSASFADGASGACALQKRRRHGGLGQCGRAGRHPSDVPVRLRRHLLALKPLTLLHILR